MPTRNRSILSPSFCKNKCGKDFLKKEFHNYQSSIDKIDDSFVVFSDLRVPGEVNPLASDGESVCVTVFYKLKMKTEFSSYKKCIQKKDLYHNL